MEPVKERSREAGWGNISCHSAPDGACGSRASLEGGETKAAAPRALGRPPWGAWALQGQCLRPWLRGQGSCVALVSPFFELVRRSSW